MHRWWIRYVNVTTVFFMFILLNMGQIVFSRFADAGYGRCGECNKTWNVVEHHSIPYDDGREFNGMMNGVPIKFEQGMFPLCETCFWKVSDKRLKYHIDRLVDEWTSYGSDKNPELAKASALKNALSERARVTSTTPLEKETTR